ncbi:putative histone deacetylase [Lyophyllum shimeji]|uniref:histone deacetylase n=1 Tax=Lyophyllum shimeji TaxID=47721 RepID=A0A9P3UIE8_LYOSH|nr:putative histone deacetylase [Lyophyllum shimeji]
MSKRRVAYYYDPDAGAYTYGLGHLMKPHRVRVTHELLTAYDMLGKMQVLRPKRASAEDMTMFHTDEYVQFLHRVTPETVEELTGHGSRFLVGDDNPAFEGVFEFCSISAGGSIGAAERIASGAADIAINWAGGLHHAKKREASGFCYINDIVLGILELLRTYPRVLYIDIDCHHGDGVEEAFYTTDRVMTCSFHKFGEFFPGTGTQEDKGRGKGKGYSVNVPLKDGITDEAFRSVFDPIIAKILEVYRPSAVVLQCGADSLAGDRLGCFNLTMGGHAHCVQFLRKYDVPLILLGGGGYTVKNVVRAWAYETACALGIQNTIDRNLPWNPYFEWFGPRYRLEVLENNMDDLNNKDGLLDKIRETALQQLQELAHAPSVGMHDVPRESIGEHLGFRSDRMEAQDPLDAKLAQHARYVYDLQDSDNTPSDTSHDEKSWDSDNDSASHTQARYQHQQQRKFAQAQAQAQQRMSIVTGQYFDVPVPAVSVYEHGGYMYGAVYDHRAALLATRAKRRFFQSAARWDETVEGVVASRYAASPMTMPIPRYAGGVGVGVGVLMERGGGHVGGYEGEEEEWDEMMVDA